MLMINLGKCITVHDNQLFVSTSKTIICSNS